MNSSFTAISASDLRRAAEIKDKIEALESELNNILADGGAAPRQQTQAKYKMSAAGLARIRAAQKARWARFRAGNGKAAPAPKRRMSAAAKAKIAAAARARWRKAKAAGRNAL